MWKAPIVEEVRAARQALAAQCGYDPQKMLEQDREVVKSWKGRVVTKEDLARRHRTAARKA
ncbi:MAG: hypothetical protein FJ291_03010 [Planctomycetes bacterium]|nr:hypothetical protein [Planctomycetota bacterium]